jgi:membrane protein
MIGEKHVTTHAAAADYHLVIALPPAMMLLISLIRFLPVTQEEVLQRFSETMPEQVYSILESIVGSIFNSTETVTIISAVLLLISASSAMRALMRGIYEIYGARRKEPFLLFAAKAVLYTLVFLVMIVVSLAVMVYGAQLLEFLRGRLKDQSFIDTLISVLQNTRYLLWTMVLTVVFMVFYHFLPAENPKFKNQFPGALFSAISWAVFSWGYSIYVSVSDKFGAYGYLGTIMIIMMWMYYCLMFFLIGGCINVYTASAGRSNSACQEEEHLG